MPWGVAEFELGKPAEGECWRKNSASLCYVQPDSHLFKRSCPCRGRMKADGELK